MNRRTFLKKAARTAGLAGVSTAGVLLQVCAGKKEYDIVVKNGLVYDGSGGRPFKSDLGITADTIRTIGKIENGRGKMIIEAEGLAASPGFIDVHDHTDISLLVNPRAESVIHQGITTLLSGNCGGSAFPIPESLFEEQRDRIQKAYGVDLTWRDMAGFLGRLEEQGIALNYATLLGHGSLRGAVVGFNDRQPTAVEMEKMERLLEEHLRGGAFGLSSGLEYTPGSFARPEELAELCRVVARFDAVYATHMRDEEDGILESIAECLGAARNSGARLQISHLKVGGSRNWPLVDAALTRIEEAKQAGTDVFCDRYPYIAGSTGLSILFPLWAREGTTAEFIGRLQDPSLEARLRAHLAEQEDLYGSWEKVLISEVASEGYRRLQGKSILEAAGESGKQPYDFMRDLLVEENGMVRMILFYGSEEVLKRILAHPLVGVGCDGSAVAPSGVLSAGKPHPRNYGTFPRVLGKYVREEKIVPAEEMIKKMTAIPALRFGFERRGLIRPEYFADLVIFNPETIADRATWDNPHQFPLGIEFVIVNGRVVVGGGEHTGLLPGRILRKKA
ncbi:MAG: D-aminoacylase [Acidobacteriota bacterium]